MPKTFPANSVGLVSPQQLRFDKPFTLANGRVLRDVEVVYETYGVLNEKQNNAVLICHALSGDHHAAGYHNANDKHPGWWDSCIGPGKVIDTNVFFVVCMNNLGGCAGTTGPTSINPDTGKIWGKSFPHLRVRDWVHSQKILMDHLQISSWAAIIGGSLGGMQAMRWSLEYPELVKHAIVIASSMRLSAQNIAFNETARQAITSDPDFHDGDYLSHNTYPQRGLAVARMIGHITYLSDDAMGNKFGRELSSGSFDLGTEELVEFQVESYLRYQGEKFSSSFDANTYILMTKALDYFDLGREYDNNPAIAFKKALSKFLVISFTSDWRFSPERSKEITRSLIAAGKEVCYAEVDAPQGHDAFLLEIPRYLEVFGAYMERVKMEANSCN